MSLSLNDVTLRISVLNHFLSYEEPSLHARRLVAAVSSMPVAQLTDIAIGLRLCSESDTLDCSCAIVDI
eukprot:6211039-Pleurochrysis_carterae.AAC.1